MLLAATNLGTAQSQVSGWGVRAFDSGWYQEQFTGIATGGDRTVAIKTDGSIAIVGAGGAAQAPGLPAGLTYVEAAAGGHFTVARRNDGSVVAWGDNQFGQTFVPPLPSGLVYVEVASGWYHSLARQSDGSVVAWGDNTYGQCDVPPLPAGLTYVGIAAGPLHSLAVRSDGSAVAWGDNGSGQCNVPAPPGGLTYVEVSGGEDHSVARRSDGSVVAWGNNDEGQCNVPALPTGLVYEAVAASEYRSMARSGPPTPLSVYCAAKTNSLGCVPAIEASGGSSATAGSGFLVTGVHIRNNRSGFLFYGVNGSASLPFQGGTKCVNPPIKRTPVQNSLGTPAPANDCSGIYALDMNAFALGGLGGNPLPALSMPGTVVNCQWWGRDEGSNVTLTDGLEYTIGL